MFTVNRQPIGLSSALECVRSSDVVPIWSKLQPADCSMKNCSKVLNEALREFQARWDCLYKSTILKQKKWMQSNHNIEKGDLVLITDLLGKLNNPQHGRISKIEKDNAGVERYFTVEYKTGNRSQSVVKVQVKTNADLMTNL